MRRSIPSVARPDVAPAINAIKEVLEVGMGMRGAESDRFLTVGDLTATGLAVSTSNGLAPADAKTGEAVDLTPPPAITGLIATAALTSILLEWNPSTAHNYAYTEIWRAPTNDRNLAARVGASTGSLYADAVALDSTFYYWARAVSTADVVGAWNAAFDAGVQGQTQQSSATILGTLTTQIRPGQIVWRDQVVYETNLFAIVAPRSSGDAGLKVPFVVGTIGGVSTVGINGQLVVDGTIRTNAIAVGAVTADRITVLSLSAISANLGSVTAGTLDVGASSWKVKVSSTGYPLEYRNIYSGERRFYFDDLGNAYFKGAIEALSGTFTGEVKSGSTITGSNIAGGTLNIGSPGFHVAANGDAWAGHASYASAPFRVETNGAVHSGLGSASTHMANGSLWTGSSSFNTAPFRVDAYGNLVANNIMQASMVPTGSNPQPQIPYLYMDAANVKNLTADKILAGTLVTGVLISGSGIFGNITAASIHADNVTGDIVTVEPVNMPNSSTPISVGGWTQVISVTVSAPKVARGHHVIVSLALGFGSPSPPTGVTARVLINGVERGRATGTAAAELTLPLNATSGVIKSQAFVSVEASTVTGVDQVTLLRVHGSVTTAAASNLS